MEKNNPDSLADSSFNTASRTGLVESVSIPLEDLLSAYVAGDEGSFEKLFDDMGGRIFAFIYRYIGNNSQAEDVYQDVCLKVALKASTYSKKASVSAWIFQIARNSCIDFLRSKGRRPVVSVEGGVSRGDESPAIEIEDKDGSDPAEEAALLELGLIIDSAVDKLPDEQKEVFLLKEEGGLTFEQIGEIVRCGKETAKSRMRYALERLRNSLGKEAKHYGLH
ncbi:MAG: sigma-70 family RNA polymerase sigma factor [Planctomycetota bacterium]|jgi:RNA polymerase sigma-70 factor (ECF subfamily)